ncbi:uncharacterized protein F4822DRAFT_445312 [Hypoxylon trugodes]|uniref:uncharacterized protein n=1 Tax=Hypoxylon trugodes TaxID=326681 RepID=UPI00219A466F|nr:uncharacterized protein F4822DRAFT_445312 [Hypoxylon trugodes]KAI1385347.1 hypothetical protein F4822DRAFT_445312 [Hypoxylon trugodes]
MEFEEIQAPPGVLRSLFHHVALPSKLPGGAESNITDIERGLLDRLIAATKILENIQQDDVCRRAWSSIRRSLLFGKALNIGGKIERSQLASHLRQLHNSDLVILHVAAQNAGVVIHKPVDPELRGNILFEAFEASPKREPVLASQTLSWTFPGTAVLVPSEVFYKDSFLESLTAFFEQVSVESTQKFSEYAIKAGKAIAEDRENPDPALITSFLTAILEANGKRISPKTLRKRVRDEVCWFDSGSPWRRLPYWLVLRVSIARYLAMMLGGAHGRIQYKFLMCIIHGMVLNDIRNIATLEDQDFLKRKLCRRLYKLDRDHLEQPQETQRSYDALINHLAPRFTRVIRATATRIEKAWEQEKQQTTKVIPQLPRQSEPKDQKLSLNLSREYLAQAQERHQNNLRLWKPPKRRRAPQPSKQHIQAFGNKLLSLFDKENQMCMSATNLPCNSVDASAQILELHQAILDYIGQINGDYDGNAEQKGIMLLALMETWTALDKAACDMFPLLYDFHPVFTPRLVEVLHLSLFSDVVRARKVESYIRCRVSRSKGTPNTLFDNPCKGCFAERFFDASDDGFNDTTSLKELLRNIQSMADQQREKKEREWQEMSSEYDRLTREYDSSTCIYYESVNASHPIHYASVCPKCQFDRERSQMKITTFESPLPENTVMAKAVVFELRCPEELAAYRDATWAILSRVAKQIQEPGVKPKVCLEDYSRLQMYSQATGDISLASTTKSFLMTHYRDSKFPVDLNQVILPNGLKFAYFDKASQCWPGNKDARPTFEHHCKLTLPANSPFLALLDSRSFNVYGNGPSSYEVSASHPSCPSSLNAHEYAAFQYLLSGKRRRWLTILTELGSSNLNLSTETTVLLFDHLVHQIGPSEEHDEIFGTVHYVFRDAPFCNALLKQLTAKLEAIASNWRETHLMEIIIMLTLRLITFTTSLSDMSSFAKTALGLLLEARQVTLQWARMLRKEMDHGDGSDDQRNYQSYLLWAALLCKRTFASYQMPIDQDLEPNELSIFVECSATVYDNMPDNVGSLGRILKNTFVRDLRMTYDLKDQLQALIEQCGKHAILIALKSLWPPAESKSISGITFGSNGWLKIELEGYHEEVEFLEYNYVFGILLVDGEPLSKLTADSKITIILEELFGGPISLRKWPSKSPGMTYVLAVSPKGYQIHVGYADRGTIIHATKGTGMNRQTLEIIPREIFYQKSQFDIPAALIENCIHWLDLTTGILEIRSKSRNIWKPHHHNWKLDTYTSTCSRFTLNGKFKETLIDPYSPLFNRVSNIFLYFELAKYLTIYQQGGKYSLAVEMPRLQLKWHVNKNRMLESSHLRAEIDPCQDIDTWHGFDSKLVCRNLRISQERFVLVPLGPLAVTKRGCHVQVYVETNRDPSRVYIRFMVNKTLGRLDCAAEPVLVYKKAEIHAFTSFVLPDTLTGLTGIESSLAILSSGMSQPWSPLSLLPTTILRDIAQLSPRREYYPVDLKVMKKEYWDRRIPATFQREEFRILVGRIISRSNELAMFSSRETEKPELPPSGDAHLSLRSLRRHRLYERCYNSDLKFDNPDDTVYEARHTPPASSLRYSNVLESTSILRDRPMFMSTVEDIALNLSQSLHISGYSQTFDKVTLHDRLDVDVRHEWGPLVNFVRDVRCQYRLMFFIGMISFRYDANMPLIRTLIAFAHWDDLRSLTLPNYADYSRFRPRQTPQLDTLVEIIEPHKAPVPDISGPLAEFASSKEQRKVSNARNAHIRKASADCRELAEALILEWPSPNLVGKNLEDSYLIDVPAALNQVRPEWERLYYNHEFFIHLQEVQSILNQRRSDVAFKRPDFVRSEFAFPIQQPGYELPTLGNDMMKMSLRKIGVNGAANRRNSQRKYTQLSHPRFVSKSNVSQELAQIIGIFSSSTSIIKRKYAEDLRESLAAFDARNLQDSRNYKNSNSQPIAERTVAQLQEIVKTCIAEIVSAVEQPNSEFSKRQISWLQQGQLWPAITLTTLLEQLRSSAKRSFGGGMKEGLLYFALSITNLQRQIRMQSYLSVGENARYDDEKKNVGHSNWRIEDYTDWILLEIESNLLIRETQVDVALAIIAPESKANSVLQLNMGQGKTSCIIPMAAVVLADNKNLVRVSVPKALLQQTAQLLHGRLGGLVGREISHIPFSRRTPTKENQIKLFHRIHREIQRKQGVMLCLPEHQMSFMLSGLQRVLDQQIPEASMMIRVQKWLQSCARDVLDESDHTLAVKTQLIYPSGSQMAVDGHPHRWLVVEQILGLVDMHLHDLSASFPHSIEVVRRPRGGFPFVFFLRPDVEEEMVKRLRYDVCQGVRGIVPIDSVEQADRLAIKEFLSSGKVRQSSLDRISYLCPDRPHVKQTIYLLRGLFVHRILIMALKKRYGVQYGLHPDRDPVAVPFHAKGVPSEQSEFGHVDVAILLTALAFYYCGINMQQTRQALEAVLKSDDPASEYDKWTEDENFPDYLRDWHSINVDDSQQMSQIWGSVRFKVPVIDYFMNNFVFPPHAKQFKVRLQSNGWDIPLPVTQSDKTTKHTTLNKSRGLTTGFSGTNDIKPLLPLTIAQDDLASLSHTNAEVLTYLLQPRSRKYVVMADHNQKRLNEIAFLHMLKRHNIRVLIDSGAQILEQSNKELAENWLNVDGRATVVLYFEGDTPYILSKQGTKVPLLASPYADNLNEVLVYLDEAHTRGTDLKFGIRTIAALTLGLGQTKDHTVQAAMRLRQLGTTQSVVFFAPPEVNQSIRDLCNKKDSDIVDSHDVIYWLINNTCDGIEQLQPLYYSQGTDFCNRMQAAEDYPDFLVDEEHRSAFTDAIKHKERQSLQQLYGPQMKSKTNTSTKSNPRIADFVKELEIRRKGFQDTGQAVHASALQEVEQERETEIEVEAVRQVKKPLSYIPHKFPGLHKDLETFARTGRIPAGSDNFIHILRALARTSLGRKYKVNHAVSSSMLFVSSEFERTVKLVIESTNDNFMRPVQWILYSHSPEAAVVVTPEEAELIIEILQETVRKNRASATRLLTYAAPVTRRMLHFNNLRFYSMPPLPDEWQPAEWFTTELGLFAGRLYFEWSEYDSICRILGIDSSALGVEEFDSSEAETNEQYTESVTGGRADATLDRANGVQDAHNNRVGGARRPSQKFCGLTPKPYTFVQEYLAVRRRGQDFTHTPMGFICSGKPLSQDSAFFRRIEASRRVQGLMPTGAVHTDNVEDEAPEEMMDLGNYDPSAEVGDDEDHVSIEYDESEMHRASEESIDSDDEAQSTEAHSSGVGRRRQAGRGIRVGRGTRGGRGR